jgi:hypothetical protein
MSHLPTITAALFEKILAFLTPLFLVAATSDPDDPALLLNQVLRLRGNANALNRAAQQNETRLEKLQKQPPLAEEAPADTAQDVLPASSATADLLAFARSKLKSMMGGATPAAPAPAPIVPLSRQQRRDAERKAEKIRQRHQEDARRAARTEERLLARANP